MEHLENDRRQRSRTALLTECRSPRKADDHKPQTTQSQTTLLCVSRRSSHVLGKVHRHCASWSMFSVRTDKGTLKSSRNQAKSLNDANNPLHDPHEWVRGKDPATHESMANSPVNPIVKKVDNEHTARSNQVHARQSQPRYVNLNSTRH